MRPLATTNRGLSSFVPSLALLSEQLLGQPLRGRDPSAPLSSSQQQPQHDSREDASVALALVKLELQPGAAGSAPLDPPDLKVRGVLKLCVVATGGGVCCVLFSLGVQGASACTCHVRVSGRTTALQAPWCIGLSALSLLQSQSLYSVQWAMLVA